MRIKQLISILLTVTLILTMAPMSVFAADTDTIVITWTSNGDGTGLVTLSCPETPERPIVFSITKTTGDIIATPQDYTAPYVITSEGLFNVLADFKDKPPESTEASFTELIVNMSTPIGIQPTVGDSSTIPSITAVYDKVSSTITLLDNGGGSYNIYYAVSDTQVAGVAIKALQASALTYSGAFYITPDKATKYIYTWHTMVDTAYDKVCVNELDISPAIPSIDAEFQAAQGSIKLTETVGNTDPFYYYVSTTDEGSDVQSKLTSGTPRYTSPFMAPTGVNWVWVTVWHSNNAVFKDKYQTHKLQVASPVPAVTMDVNNDTKKVLLTDTASTTLPIYYYYDGIKGQTGTTANERQDLAEEYTSAGFFIPTQYDSRDILLWHGKDNYYSGRTQELKYIKNQDAPSDSITYNLQHMGTYYQMEINSEAQSELFSLYYKLTVDSVQGSAIKYTAPLRLAYDASYSLDAYYSKDGGLTPQNITSYAVEIDDEGNFSKVTADKNLTVTAKGKYLFFSGPSVACEYDITVYNADTDSVLTTLSQSGPFTNEMFVIPDGVAKYRVAYEITEKNKLVAHNSGTPTQVDSTYMPEPFNLTWNAVLSTASAEISLPADTCEYELYNLDIGATYQSNTTGEFTNVPSGKYELRAVAYHSQDDQLRSTATVLKLTIDKDPPRLTLLPVTMAGSLPGVIVTAEDLGSGINRIELMVNGTAYANIKSGDTVYAKVEGINTIVVTAYDNASNSTVEKAELKFDKNTLNPTIEVVGQNVDEDGNWLLWYNKPVNVTVSAANAATNLKYLILSNGAKMLHMLTKAPAEASLSFDYALESDGRYELSAQAISPDGTQSGNLTKRQINIDSTAPTTPEIYVDKKGYMTIEASDKMSGLDYIEYHISGKKREKYDGEVKVTGDGEVTITAVAYDIAGNASKAGTWKGEIFTTAPEDPTLEGTGSSWVTTEDPVSVTITSPTQSTDANKLTIYYRLGTDLKSDGWRTFKEGEEILIEEEGITKISTYVRDSHGNESDVVVGYVKIDITPPSMRAITTSPFTASSTRTSFKLWFRDDESGIDKLFVSVNGKERRIDITSKHKAQGYVTMTLTLPAVDLSATTVEASTGNEEFDSETYDPAQHIVLFRALDKAGNESKIELSSKSYDATKSNPHTGGKSSAE